MYPVRLWGRTLMLREFNGEDASGLYKVYGDADATRHLSFEPKDMEQVSAVVKSAMTSATANPRVEYMLAIAEGGGEELGGLESVGAAVAGDGHVVAGQRGAQGRQLGQSTGRHGG